MSCTFVDRLCDLITAPRDLENWERAEAATAFEDTMAVAYAGWHEPVVQAALTIYRGTAVPLLDGTGAASVEHAALIHATAAHALDYDDVQLMTVSHPSAPIVPALLALSDARPGLARRMIAAFAAGLAVNVAVGRVLGLSHYDKGWHATGTVGPLATAAALAHLLSFDASKTRHALALAAAQAAGLQRNFGTMAKPLQAGLASAAGVRAALLAEAGVTGDPDIFGPRGYFDLYAGIEAGEGANLVTPQINLGVLSRKLYPCCYMNHRLISAGFAARAQLHGVIPENAEIRVTAPSGSLTPLRFDDPRSGAEAKFCGPYSIAAALFQGSVTFSDFDDDAVLRPAIRALMGRINLSEENREDGIIIGLDRGVVRMTIESGGNRVAFAEAEEYPGSPRQPATEAEMTKKLTDCLTIYRRRSKAGPTFAEFRTDLRARIDF